MSKEYPQVNPSLYTKKEKDAITGEDLTIFDSTELKNVPIRIGRDSTTKELFDSITKQLIDEGLVSFVDSEDKSYITYKDDSSGIEVEKVIEDKGDGILVTFNENGTLSKYEEKEIDMEKSEKLEESEYESEDLDKEEEELF